MAFRIYPSKMMSCIFWKHDSINGSTLGLRIDSLTHIEGYLKLPYTCDRCIIYIKHVKKLTERLEVVVVIVWRGCHYAGQQHKFWTGASDLTEKLLFTVLAQNDSKFKWCRSCTIDARIQM